MFRNYFRTALQNLLKNRLFSVINVGGLAIGLAACILISLYVRDETSYDAHWRNADRLYRLNTSSSARGNGLVRTPVSAGPAVAALKRDFPGAIERGSRIMSFERQVEYREQTFEDIVAAVDPDLIDMFDFEVLAGDLAGTLADPSSIALDAAFAARIFGTEAAIGEVLDVSLNGATRSFRLGAVYRLAPGNTVLDLPGMILLDESTLPRGLLAWGNDFFTTFIQFAENADVAAVVRQLPAFRDRNVDLSATGQAGGNLAQRYAFDLQPISTLHLDSPFDTTRPGGDRTVVLAFSVISALVLLIGCVNFTILSTARATRRAREVAMRKVVGASRRQLVFQYLGESLLVVAPAMIIALALVEVALPTFQALVGKALAMHYAEPRTVFALLGLLLMVGIAGGLYPAFILSHYRPAASLKASRSAEARGAAKLRASLVLFQFSVSIALMIATAVIYLQVHYASSRDPGFNPENLLTIDNLRLRADVYSRIDVLKQQLESLPDVSSVALSSSQPTQKVFFAMNFLNYTVRGGAAEGVRLATLGIDADFFDTYGTPLLAGRTYAEDRDLPTQVYVPGDVQVRATPDRVVINASAARELGFASAEAAIGNVISGDGVDMIIIGVAPDTHFLSMNATPRAEVYLYGANIDVVTVRYSGERQTLLADVRNVWEQVMGGAELSTGFVEQNMEREFGRERTEAVMLISFALLAIVIACLGLFGSAAYTVERRTREIGIRKVMGAEVGQIVRMLLWQFSRPVMLANIVAWPVALWAMLNWLQRFPYQMDIWMLAPVCLGAGLVALVIASLTVAGNTLRVATSNPVHALRYE